MKSERQSVENFSKPELFIKPFDASEFQVVEGATATYRAGKLTAPYSHMSDQDEGLKSRSERKIEPSEKDVDETFDYFLRLIVENRKKQTVPGDDAFQVLLPSIKINGHDTVMRLSTDKDGTTTISLDREVASKESPTNNIREMAKLMSPEELIYFVEQGHSIKALELQNLDFHISKYPDGRYAIVGDHASGYQPVTSYDTEFGATFTEAAILINDYLKLLKTAPESPPTTYEQLQKEMRKKARVAKVMKFLLS